MLKLPKLLLELKKIRYQEIKFDTGIMIFNLLFIISLLAHWLACIWTFLSGLNASISLGSNYINSIYLIITTLTTVGYGDIVPQNDIQKIFTMIVQLLGIGIYGFVIGNITLQLNKRDPAKQIHQINIEKLKALIKYHNIPQEFRFRVKNYYDYMWNNKIGQDAAGLLDGLPLQLKSEISTYLKNEVIAKIQLFKGMDKVFLKQLASKLEPVILIPGDKIFETGDPGDAMFFIIRGNLIILNKDANLINTLSTGDFFGEISLFENRKRSATVIAKSFCELYKLSKDDFEKVINIDSEIYHKIRSKADSRIKKYT